MIKSWTLAKLGSTMYGDLYDASAATTLIDADDVVMEESRTYRDEETGAALMQVQVSRAHDNIACTLWSSGINPEYYETQPGACQTTAIRFGYAGYVRDRSGKLTT